MLESKAGIVFIAGIGFFVFAFVSNVVVPVLMFQDLPEQTAEDVVTDNVLYQFVELSKRYPESFRNAYGEPTKETVQTHCDLAVRSTSEKDVGTVTVNSCDRCPTSRSVMELSRKHPNIKTNCNARFYSVLAESVRI